jgi:hypothetical protein
MAFNVSLIQLAAEADELLRMAQRDKRNMGLRKDNITVRNLNSAEDVNERKAELVAAELDLASSTAKLATLTAGTDAYVLEKIKNLDLEGRVLRLKRAGNKAGTVATLEQAYDLAAIEAELKVVDDFIAEVTARKAAL